MLNRNYFLKNQYLSQYDLITKYTLKSLNLIPVIKEINFNIPLENFLKSSEPNKSLINSELEIKAYAFFYLLFNKFPLLKAKVKQIKSTEKVKSLNYFLSLSLKNKFDINNFLILLFIESWNKLVHEKLITFSSNFALEKKLKINFLVPASLLEPISLINKNVLTNLNSNNLLINIHLFISIPIIRLINKKTFFLKNLPIFWING